VFRAWNKKTVSSVLHWQQRRGETVKVSGATAMEHSLTGRNRLLHAMPPSERALIERDLQEVAIEQGQVLQEQGDTIEAVYFPASGLISLIAAMQGGDKIIEAATIGRDGALGAMAGFGPRRAFRRAIVQVAGVAARISTARLQEAVNASAALRDVLARYSEVLLAQVQQLVACNAFHEAEERLARWLLQAHDRVDGDIIPLTQEALAQMLGVRRTTVTIIAHELQKRGLLRYRRGRIEVTDRHGLETVACECYAAERKQVDEYFPPVGPAAPLQ
jgi:CRP-like cAMP-binding protein